MIEFVDKMKMPKALERYRNLYNEIGNEHVDHPDDVDFMMQQGNYFLWQNEDMIILTSIQEDATEKYLVIHSVLGHNFRKWWQETIRTLETFSTSVHCSKVKIVARAGWLKFLTDYKIKSYIIQKDLNYG